MFSQWYRAFAQLLFATGIATDCGDKPHVHDFVVDIFDWDGSRNESVRPHRRGMHDRHIVSGALMRHMEESERDMACGESTGRFRKVKYLCRW